MLKHADAHSTVTNIPAARTHSHTYTHAHARTQSIYAYMQRASENEEARANSRTHTGPHGTGDWIARRSNPPTRTRLGMRQACIETNSRRCMARGASQGTAEIRRVPCTCAAAAATSTSSPAARRARAMRNRLWEGRFRRVRPSSLHP